MKPFIEFPAKLRGQIRFVLTDVDDTLTDGPHLRSAAYMAIERLRDAGIIVIPVTAAPAGWCDLMARMWPVGAVIGENGGLCYRRDPTSGIAERHYWAEPAERKEDVGAPPVDHQRRRRRRLCRGCRRFARRRYQPPPHVGTRSAHKFTNAGAE